MGTCLTKLGQSVWVSETSSWIPPLSSLTHRSFFSKISSLRRPKSSHRHLTTILIHTSVFCRDPGKTDLRGEWPAYILNKTWRRVCPFCSFPRVRQSRVKPYLSLTIPSHSCETITSYSLITNQLPSHFTDEKREELRKSAPGRLLKGTTPWAKQLENLAGFHFTHWGHATGLGLNCPIVEGGCTLCSLKKHPRRVLRI